MTTQSTDPQEIVVPLCEEQASIAKRRIVTGRVQVSRVTCEHEQLLEETLAREQVEIERIPIGKPVEVLPSIREEGDTIVIPIVEEILVVERRLLLKEEVRVRRVRSQESHRERVKLRRQEAMITRDPVEPLVAAEHATDETVNPNQTIQPLKEER
jgi:stress response protein YsnF